MGFSAGLGKWLEMEMNCTEKPSLGFLCISNSEGAQNCGVGLQVSLLL
jgi:hypothetical protein